MAGIMKSFLGARRVQTLNDGVFSIVMTLLAFDLKVSGVHENLAAELAGISPRLFIYAVSFIILGLYWIGHHNHYHFIKYVDRTFLWINIFFLMFVALVPFTTSMIGFYGNQLALILYGINLVILGMLSYIHWTYATHNHRLVEHKISPALVRMTGRRILFSPSVSAFAVAVSFFSTGLSMLLYAMIPVYYMIPGKVDDFWKRPAKPHKD